LFQGALIGGITSLAGSLWLTFGSIMMKQRHPTLPPLSTDRCTMTNNLTYSDYKNTNFSSINQFFDESPINATMTYFHLVTNKTNGVTSLSHNQGRTSHACIWGMPGGQAGLKW